MLKLIPMNMGNALFPKIYYKQELKMARLSILYQEKIVVSTVEDTYRISTKAKI